MAVGVMCLGGPLVSESGEQEEKLSKKETLKKEEEVRNEPAHIRTPAKSPSQR